MVDDLSKLRESLNRMPVPEPREGFVDRVLANASSEIRRPFNWWAAGLGALAATLACVALLWRPADPTQQASVRLALNESRDVSLVIESERALEGATIRLYVTGSVELAGYEQQHEIEWKTSLTAGANLLSLPVVGRAPGDGLVIAEIEHQGHTRRLSLALHVTAPGDDSA